MKVIDKTPFQDEKGNFSLVHRFQAVVEYGFNWFAEIEAQKTVIAQLDRVFEKGYTLIRNLNLEKSQILEPLILVGPPGVFVISVTPVSGYFEAKGDEWNVIRNDRRAPAQVNLLKRVLRLARAVQVYLNRQNVFLPGVVEPVLIAAHPGVHIETLRPIVRVVLGDAVKQWAASLEQARPILRSDAIHEVVDHLINPHQKPATPRPDADLTPAKPMVEALPPTSDEAPRRARAIFHAAEQVKPFDPADLSFEFDEKAAEVPAGLRETSPSQPLPRGAARKGFSGGQWTLLILMMLVELIVLAGFVYFMFFGTS